MMRVSVNAFIAGLTVLMVVGLIFVLIYGCMSFSYLSQEHFSTKMDDENKKDNEESASASASADLTDKEKELFEDLKNNKLSTERIGDLVTEGVLTQELVEKFLNQLNITPDDTPSRSDDKKDNNRTTNNTVSNEKEEDFTIEGFTAGGYAKY